MTEEFPSQPIYTTLRRWLRKRFPANSSKPVLSPSDSLWFFFSGHGLRHQGQDYLLLSDSDPDPEEIDNSAISINFVTEHLRRSGAGNIMLFIDACRDSAKSVLGIDLQSQQGVISIASCSPNERSYEIHELGHGSFTYALIESLTLQGENNCATVERLCKRLRQRVREINQQYRKSKQTPYPTIEPETKNYLILLPDYIKPTLADIATLKTNALRAEFVENNLKLAEVLWTRLVTHDLDEALDSLLRIRQKLQGGEVRSKPDLMTEIPVKPQTSNNSGSKSLQHTFKQDSPSIVCNYLDEDGLKTRGYKDMWEDGQSYTCFSPYQLLGDVSLELPNNIAYYVTGKQTEVTELLLLLNINYPQDAKNAHDTLIHYAEILFKKAFDINLPAKIKKAIENGLSDTVEIEHFYIKVIREDLTIGKGYRIKLIITDEDKSETKEIELKSEKGIDYKKLSELLEQGKWKEADKETVNVMLQAANRVSEGYLRVEDIDKFPCEDLRTINQLWLHYSQGKFGFSVQAEIYRSFGGTEEYNSEVWEQFGDAVGWRVNKSWLYYSDYTFDLSSTRGNLPVIRGLFDFEMRGGKIGSSLLSRPDL